MDIKMNQRQLKELASNAPVVRQDGMKTKRIAKHNGHTYLITVWASGYIDQEKI